MNAYSLIFRIFESDDSADDYGEKNNELEDFKDKDSQDEFSDSDKIPLNDLLKEDNGEMKEEDTDGKEEENENG
jgi:hypothetical protein